MSVNDQRESCVLILNVIGSAVWEELPVKPAKKRCVGVRSQTRLNF